MIFTVLAGIVLRVAIYAGLILSSLWLLWTYPWTWLMVHLASCGWLVALCRGDRVERLPAATRHVSAMSGTKRYPA